MARPLPPIQQQELPAQTVPRRAVLLLPLSGPHAELGNQLMMAVQLAVQDLAPENFVVAPADTARGAAAALQQAMTQQTDVIIGPLFSADVAATKTIAANAGIPMLALSNDQSQADANTYLMGAAPGEQIERVVRHAEAQGLRRFVAVLPENAYGQAVKHTLNDMVQSPSQLVQVYMYDTAVPNVAAITSALAANPNAYDAVVLPDGEPRASTFANAFVQGGALENANGPVRLLGSALWEGVGDTGALAGGWYAAQDANSRQQFTNRYLRTFGVAPPKVADLAYDATALAAVLASRNWPYATETLTQSQGFAGMGGIFRLHGNGMTQRALAVQEVGASGRKVIEQAPNRF